MMKSQEFMTLGMMLEVVGIVFGTERLIGYPLIGTGVLLSIISVIRSKREVKKKSLNP